MIFLEIFICIIGASFFAGLETGLLSANQLTLFSKADKGYFYARAAKFLLIKPERLLSTTLIGTNIAVIAATVLLKNYLTEIGIPSWGSWLGSFGLSIVLLIFSEIIPKSFFRLHADTISLKLAPLLVFFFFLFFLFAFVLNGVIKIFLIIFNKPQVQRGVKSRSDLKMLLKLVGKEAGIPIEGRYIFNDIFDFKKTLAREVMIPFHQIPACSYYSPIEEAVKIYMKTNFPYIVIFVDRTDNVVGYINVEDLLAREFSSVKEVMKHVVFYPDIKPVPDLFIEMNRRRLDLVFLSDEYGGVSGLITPNQIASEIIGKVPGFTKKEEKELEQLEEGHFIASGITNTDDFMNITAIALPEGPYDTIGGYLCHRMGRIPVEGALFKEKGVLFKILERDDRHVKKVEVKRIKKDETETKSR